MNLFTDLILSPYYVAGPMLGDQMENLPPRGQQGLGQRVTETSSRENPLQSNTGCCGGRRLSGAQAGQSRSLWTSVCGQRCYSQVGDRG